MKNNYISFSDLVDEKIKKRSDSKISRLEYLDYLYKTENLKLPKGKIKTYSISSFDIETTSSANNFYLFGFIDKDNNYIHSFDKVEALKILVNQKHRGNFIYATNLGFDFNSVAEGTDFKNECDILLRGNSYLQINYDSSYNFKVSLRDSTNYGGLSVESMGKILKLPKLKSPRCLGRHPKNKKELKELIDYNKRDCEVTKKFMELLQTGLNDLGGELKMTISSCAMDMFRRNFLDYDVIREKHFLDFEPREKIFKAYYGGRTETFKRGTIKNYNYYDFNSLYPSVMLYDYPNPTSVQYVKENNNPFVYLSYEGVSYFELNIPYSEYPLLPYRTIDKKLIFPYGIIKGYYTHVEIREAIKLYGEKIILKMNDTIYYTEVKPYFKKYVTTLYNLRKEYKSRGDEREHVVKLLMNSLYGRFALRNIEKTEFINIDNVDEAREKVRELESKGIRVNINSVNEMYYSEKEEYEGITSFPIWSVYVTAYARIKLHRAILECKPVYVDTDSLITETEYTDSKELGELKLEKKIKMGVIIKPKLYFCDDEIKSKGVPIPKLQKDKIRLKNNILSKKEVHYKKFIKVKEGIKRDIKVNSIIIQKKKIDLEDTKRVWVGEFNLTGLQDSEPIKINEGDEL